LSSFGEIDQEVRDHVVCSYTKGDANNTKYIDSWPPPLTAAKKIVFENVDLGYDTAEKMVIPNKPMYDITTFNLHNAEMFRATYAFGQLANSTCMNRTFLGPRISNFLRYLGYQCLGDGADANYMFVDFGPATMHGIGEASRQNLYVITPEYGPIGRLYTHATDLPLEPTKPIDAGIFRFCHSCHKCANACPPGVINQDKEPSWELAPVQGKPSWLHATGPKLFWSDSAGCTLYKAENGGCHVCWGNCTFTVNTGAMIHQIIKGTVSNSSVFNSFLYKMAESFGYGSSNQKAEDWWDKSLPVGGIDTTRVAFDGGYRHV